MSAPPLSLDSDSLAPHARHLQRLARSLVGDEEAEDLAQSTWLRMLERPPARVDGPEGLGAWLTTVLRNLVRQGARRARVEPLRDEPHSAAPGPAQAGSALEAHRAVVDAVLSLEEPYRSTVEQRFFAELSARELAARLGLPVETVRTRTKRALAMLRARLDDTHGGRDLWAGALLGLLRTPQPLILAMTVKSSLTLAAAGLAIVLLGLAVWGPWRSEGVGPATARPSELAAGESPRPGEVPATAAPGSTESRVALAQPDSPGRPSAPIAATGPAPGLRIGTVVLIDEQELEQQDLDGRLTLTTTGPTGRKQSREVELLAGSFSVEREGPREFGIEGLVLDGRPAYAEEPQHRWSDEGRLVIRARWLPITTLRVVDAVTRGDLANLTLIDDPGGSTKLDHPGRRLLPEAVLTEGARSPIQLPLRDGVNGYWVRAPGYAWGRLSVDHRSGGERSLALESGGTLTVELSEPAPGIDVRLRGFPEPPPEKGYRTGYTFDVNVSPAGRAVIEGLAEGELTLAAELGLWSDPPLVLAQEAVTIRAGAETFVTLTLDRERLGGEPAPFGGTLELASPITQSGLELSLQVKRVGGPRVRAGDWRTLRSGELRAVGGAGRVFAWDAGLVTPGRYMVRVEPLQLARFFDVEPGGTTDARIEVPALAEVFVRVVERPGDALLSLEELSWSRGTPREAGMWVLETVRREPGAEGFHFVAPVGRIGLSAHSQMHSGGSLWSEVQPGENHFEVEMTRLETIEVEFLDGRTRVPWQWGIGVDVRQVGGDQRGRAASVDQGLLTVTVPEPGTWELTVAEFTGFEPTEPVRVLVTPGETPRVEIPLRRD